MRELINKLRRESCLTESEFLQLLTELDDSDREELYRQASEVRREHYGNAVYIRGLIEFTNYCKNNCYYCGIRSGNRKAHRYRLTHSEILECCRRGYQLGFRTFVLQGGEDPFFTDEMLEDIIRDMREHYPDCAITLSIGERSEESYRRLYHAGADRYLLRHETADEEHYRYLHPKELTLNNRRECLFHLKKIGFQTGTGFMVGAPGQTAENIVKDLLFIHELQPEMVGIGPFIHHKDTPFADELSGSLQQTVDLLAIIRLMLPEVLLPATTALATIHPRGREMGILAGANVIMPNLSPLNVRNDYLLYDDKANTGDEAAESLEHLRQSMKELGYEVVTDRGDYKKANK